MNKKIKKIKKQNKDYEQKKKITEETKPLHKPLPNKFLALLIKDVIVNGDKEK